MQKHGSMLAKTHDLCLGKKSDQLLARLADNERVILNACNELTLAVKAGVQVTPAAIWLLDNFYLIEEQIRTAKRHLPKNYSKELPQLITGDSTGRPRVYDIAIETIVHGDGRVDPESLSYFVAAYQKVTVLKLGELWAIPIMLRLALIENLRGIAERLAVNRVNRNLAGSWADRMIETAVRDPNKLILLVADMARSNPPMESSFVAELVRRLQGESPSLSLPLTWLAQRLTEGGEHIDSIVQTEAQKQAIDQVSISNSISSLRFLTNMDWCEFVETMSEVNQILERDPAEIFKKMDFATRDQYRHAVEKIARDTGTTETQIAEKALQLALSNLTHATRQDRTSHVGYYLMNKGLPLLMQAVGHTPSWFGKLALQCKHRPLAMYLGGIGLISLFSALLIVLQTIEFGVKDWVLGGIILLTLICVTQFAVSIVNWLSTLIVIPVLLPRLDFSLGIPEEFRTMVTIPCMLFTKKNIDDLIESLEVRYLANHDANLRFCLLTDFCDADTETLPEDASLIGHVKANILKLNQRYPLVDEDNFLLLHRPRTWDKQDKLWMGYERKRGKLVDLNAFLLDQIATPFSVIVGIISATVKVKYVITLDTDTELPRDSARKFIGTLAHPLNQAQYDPGRNLIVDGYGILQPRVVVCLPRTDASLYELLCGGDIGIDPYTRSASDVYQDVFGEGSFIGKGIYDLEAFSTILKGRMPVNRILSHDLLEGCYLRSGLLSDVQLYEKYPSTYRDDVSRRYRWIRGDWQIASWILPHVPGEASAEVSKASQLINPLSALSKWKIADNLRRSIVPIGMTALLIAGWAGTDFALFWTCVVLAIYFIPIVCSFLLKLLVKASDTSIMQHLSALLKATTSQFLHTGLLFAFLPFEAWINSAAIILTNWRLFVTHKKLLEWNPSSESSSLSKNSLLYYFRLMWFSPTLALLSASYLWFSNPYSLLCAAPILLLWLGSPLLAFLISRPIEHRSSDLTQQQVVFLRKISRKIWLFFETYVGPNDNWLPPDNVQEKPLFAIAHRTSPTNIGLLLTTNLAAYDFGFINASTLIERSRATLLTMFKLERYRGHFFNWYDTQELVPLEPRYVSAVDSGNLTGHLLTFRAGVNELLSAPTFNLAIFAGIKDSYLMLLEVLNQTPLTSKALFEDELKLACALSSYELIPLEAQLTKLRDYSQGFIDELIQANLLPLDSELSNIVHSLAGQCLSAYTDLLYLTPWIKDLEPQKWTADIASLYEVSNLVQLAKFDPTSPLFLELKKVYQLSDIDFNALSSSIISAAERAKLRIESIKNMIQLATDFAQSDYSFLYNSITHLLYIGFNVTERRRDSGCYDLLASEARLTTFVAIAQSQLPQESWFALGRQLTIADGEPILLSWSGSMFEYLMPLLIMPTFDRTLLDQTLHSAVARQIQYGQQRSVPWGISESGYNSFDTNLNYQYRAFGVPGLGFKRGLGDDLVIAPYSSMMALMVYPEKACANLETLSACGYEGKFGFFEAIDYTKSRLMRGQTYAIIYSFMTHHQAMSFLSAAYVLLQRPMQRRFESDPLFQATMPLLLERIPKETATYSNTTELADIRTIPANPAMQTRTILTPNSTIPELQLLSNGRYHVMVTNSGAGYSQWNNLSVTRWHEDTTRDNWGTFCFVRDLEDGHYWSTGFQPTTTAASNYEVKFSEGRVEIRRNNQQFEMYTEIVVSPEDDVELRRTSIINRSRVRKIIDITSYAEVVLAPSMDDLSHPSFSNLFVQTEIIHARHAIICHRRARSAAETVPWMFHLVTVHGATVMDVSYETDRLQFIGRGNTIAQPQAMMHSNPLTNTQGSVLDPIVAIRYQIALEPDETATVDIVTGITDSRVTCLALIDKFQDRHLAYRVIELAWTHSQVALRQLNASEEDAQLYNRLASSVIYINPLLRAENSVLIRNRRGQSGLWSYTISGDLPIVLVQIKNRENIGLVHQLIQAHTYWSLRGLAVDLVIWNEDHASYRQVLQDQILGLINSVSGHQSGDRAGTIFVRIADQITLEDRILFQSVARIILTDSGGTLAAQMNRREALKIAPTKLQPTKRSMPPVAAKLPYSELSKSSLALASEFGGFSQDGKEYVIVTSSDQVTPAPWANVIANPQFGTVISESGQAYTWGENAHEFRLTPWDNDPICDPSGEAFYLRDEETGAFWSPTPLPCRGTGEYKTRHGFGYSVFEHEEAGIVSTLTVYVALDASIKYSVLQLQNTSSVARKLTATGYVEWVLGDLRSKSAMHIITEFDPISGAILARNPYNTDFCNRVAFFDVNSTLKKITCDRDEFIGRNQSLQRPAAMENAKLSGKIGSNFDPCAVIQVACDLAPGEERQFTFILGMANTDQVNISNLVERYGGETNSSTALEQVKHYWNNTLGKVTVTTPDQSINFLTNGWLLYQTIACRLWARSGYYQSGGAFGFRDQLQDCMALIHCQPALVRQQVLLHAAHQFVEGDVQHWWHPPSNRGVRTNCSDDFLWLPLAVQRYVMSSHDYGVLDEIVPFLEGRKVSPEEDSYYDTPTVSGKSATLYEHCKLAIEHGLRFGSHSLSLMGSCDWNDGMDKVGNQGKGESVWLSFFLYDILVNFKLISEQHNDGEFALRCQTEGDLLRAHIDQHAWDGAWYRRAYFDDGSPLGSAQNSECQIDSISQSWSVLSGAGDPKKSKRAMQALHERLVNAKEGIVKLLDPPFDHGPQNPGYIRGYVPGVRENGGQYTHAAIWAAMAYAQMGDSKNAWGITQIINPINHAKTKDALTIYKVEPYVVAADVYAVAPHVGRGGWTWYTGSAGWMYRLLLESLLGIKLAGNRLTIQPLIPDEWTGFELDYQFHSASYHIQISRPASTTSSIRVSVDGVLQADGIILMIDDHARHQVEVLLMKN
ncbi:cyclic beta 1-2 glucan synthetase [Sapientia aquatica]|uniref:Cyclic beta 1-2 glucan synthetase n=2 Tax=Sapientia aquatica TaxID=1549640 RepID=A0A4R5W4I4_9BURK|nr:cyclic beta 1-2 glucan synthetase [Sapientia aquatica]